MFDKMKSTAKKVQQGLKKLLRWDEIDAPIRFKLPDLEKCKLDDLKHDTGFIIDVNQDYEKGLELFFNKTIYYWKFEIKDAATEVKELYKYTCKCTELKGKENLGKICPDCETPVKEFEPDVSYRAWLELPENVVVPTYYLLNVMQELIDPHAFFALTGIKKETPNINSRTVNITDENDAPEEDKKKVVNLFCNLVELPIGDNLEQFLEAHMKPMFKRAKRAAIQEKLDFIQENRDLLFSRNIPVVSTLLRNYVYSDQWLNDTKLLHPLNSEYITIAQAIKRVRDYHDPTSKNRKNLTLLNLKTICRAMNKIDILIEEELIAGKGDSGKKKWLKDKINGHRLSHSGRAVLVPLKYTDNLYEDECILNYDIFRGVFAQEIQEYMTGLQYPMNYIQEMITTEKYALNDRDKAILDDIVAYYNANSYGLPCHINRQPSIYASSSEVVRVVRLSSEKVIRVSYTVTSDFHGDFDGDSVYVTRLPRKDKYDLYMLHIMNPRRYSVDYYKRYTGTTAPSKDAVILRYMGLNVKEDECL